MRDNIAIGLVTACTAAAGDVRVKHCRGRLCRTCRVARLNVE